MGDSELPEPTYPMTSLGVSRRIQVVRHHHLVIPRRRLSGGTEGKTTIPAKTFLQQVSDIPKTPLIQAGVVSPGVQGSAALPQATEVEEAKQAAGDPIGDEAAIARAKATATNAAAANAGAKAAAAFHTQGV
jgi:hypothetical protein